MQDNIAKRTDWSFPTAGQLDGTYVRLERLSLDHLPQLWTAASGAPDSFAYLRYGPFKTVSELTAVLEDLSSRDDQPFWAVIGENGTAEGWLSICDVYPNDGAFEIGSIWFAPTLQGTRAAREAVYLLMCLGMDHFKYERLVWRCQAENAASFRAALNLGFVHEGTWRWAAVVKGRYRDLAWFSILSQDWPPVRAAFQAWLSPANFTENGKQLLRLQDLRDALQCGSSVD